MLHFHRWTTVCMKCVCMKPEADGALSQVDNSLYEVCLHEARGWWCTFTGGQQAVSNQNSTGTVSRATMAKHL